MKPLGRSCSMKIFNAGYIIAKGKIDIDNYNIRIGDKTINTAIRDMSIFIKKDKEYELILCPIEGKEQNELQNK